MKDVIPKRMSACLHDNAPFTKGSEIFSTLRREEEAWVRSDYCKSCWEEFKSEFLEHSETFWKWMLPVKEKVPTHPDSKALTLFKTLAQTNKEEDLKKRILLALYLERKKQLILRKEDRKNKQLVYEESETGEILAVSFLVILPEESSSLMEEIINALDI